MNDQRFNPEVPITGADLYSISMSQRVLDENFESQTEPPQADVSCYPSNFANDYIISYTMSKLYQNS